MTLLSGHRIQNSSKLEGQSGVRTRDLRLSKQAALITAPGPPPLQSRATREDCADTSEMTEKRADITD